MKWIDKCLQSLKNSSIHVNIVVIDNGSNDGTKLYIENHYSETHLIINNQNRGFGQANNQGIEYAYKQGASHFFLLNQDAWVDVNTVETIVKIQDDNGLFIASPIHLNGTGNLMDSNFFDSIIINENNKTLVSDLARRKLKEFYPVDRINAAIWMLSRKTIENIGGFDPIFFHYGEDSNYCQRALYHNHKIAVVPNVFAYHDREVYGNMKVLKKNSSYMALLVKYADINRRFIDMKSDKMILHLGLIKQMLQCLISLRFKDFLIVLSGCIKFYFNIPKIIKSRRANLLKGPSWLSLQ